ncbi:MlaD family protein [Novosphingobium sp.]|uniref:MlaD family protein n=1 Tax=Novosphingobium sp. TaxID=1874826 RepID=UPI003B5251BF
METRANYVWVGAVTLALFIASALLVVWIARLSHPEQNRYDIFFKQSVDGVTKGASVSFSGVPVGQVSNITLWKKDPAYVRVRITVNKSVPILMGTTASLQGSFTGVTTIQLKGAVKGMPPITDPGPDGVPEIPTKSSGLGELLSSAPVLLEKLTNLTDRLALVLSDKNVKTVGDILTNTEKVSGSLAATAPQIKATLSELQTTIHQASGTLASFERLSESTNSAINDQNSGLMRQMRETLKSANSAATSLQAMVEETRPAVHQLNTRTLPATDAAIHDLQGTIHALHDLTDQMKDRGVGTLIGGPQLPDYKH